MVVITPFQPVLPAPLPFTEAELNFHDEEPPRIFPQNQNSNWGYKRKVFSDQMQDVIDQVALLYNEMFIDTASVFLDMHETQVGLPVAPTGFTTSQRQSAVRARIQTGPWTVARRAAIIEQFIVATLGAAISFSSGGVPFDSTGLPFYSGESGDLSSLYAVRENDPSKNMIANSNFETNITGTGGTLTLARDTSQAKFGTASVKGTLTASPQYVVWSVPISGATAGRTYACSVYVYVDPANVGKLIEYYVAETGGAFATSSPPTLSLTPTQSGWQRITRVITVVQNDRTGIAWFIQADAGFTSGNFLFFDGPQIELSPAVTDYSDQAGPAFFYEVRIKNTVTVDLASLTRELTRSTPAGISFSILSVASP